MAKQSCSDFLAESAIWSCFPLQLYLKKLFNDSSVVEFSMLKITQALGQTRRQVWIFLNYIFRLFFQDAFKCPTINGCLLPQCFCRGAAAYKSTAGCRLYVCPFSLRCI